jgi:hypothetical protein
LIHGTGLGGKQVVEIFTAKDIAALPQKTAKKLTEMMSGIASRFEAQTKFFENCLCVDKECFQGKLSAQLERHDQAVPCIISSRIIDFSLRDNTVAQKASTVPYSGSMSLKLQFPILHVP